MGPAETVKPTSKTDAQHGAASAAENPAPRGSDPLSAHYAPPVLLTPELIVEIDAEAARFVSKAVDGETREIVRQYPFESQLAFARAVRAYFTALNGRKGG